MPECGPDGIYCDSSVSAEEKYNITFSGTWTDEHKAAALEAVEKVAQKFATAKGVNSGLAWSFMYGYMNFEWNPRCDGCRSLEKQQSCGDNFEGDCAAGGGLTNSAHSITFASMSGQMYGEMDRMVKNVVHELGHAYDNVTGYRDSNGNWIRGRSPGMTFTRDVLRPNDPAGRLDWQQSTSTDGNEVYADMFIAWVYNSWNTSSEMALKVGAAKAWMP